MKVLFLCNANSCSSILYEALFNHLAPPGMRAYSAGSQPQGEVHPQVLRALERMGIAGWGLASKPIDKHAELQPDLVVTVCARAATEPLPAFLGQAAGAYWGLADPSKAHGTTEQLDAAFDATLERIRMRIRALLSLPLERLAGDRLREELAWVGSL